MSVPVLIVLKYKYQCRVNYLNSHNMYIRSLLLAQLTPLRRRLMLDIYMLIYYSFVCQYSLLLVYEHVLMNKMVDSDN